MPTYLLTWNPQKWQWTHIQRCIVQINENGFCSERWSTGVTRKIARGDRIFLMKLGQEPRGLIASGWVSSDVYEAKHWSGDFKTALYVDIHFDTIIDPTQEEVFSIEFLQDGIYSHINWTPQASGISISDDVAEQLEKDWAKFLNRSVPIQQIDYADEVDETKLFYEGAAKQVKVNRYERNAEARAICIRRYGASCSVCGFDFGKTFGDIGMGFIHVHHLIPLSAIQEDYELNPIKDLRPVCPNCHAMLHQKDPPFTIEELKSILKRVSQ